MLPSQTATRVVGCCVHEREATERVKGGGASLTGPPDLAVQSSLAVTSTPSAKATSHSRVL